MTLRAALKKAFDRVVYTSPVINRALRNLNKTFAGVTSFRLRPFGVMTVRLKSGVTFRMATNETSSVTKLLFWNGADNYEYTGVFEHLAAQSRTFLDIGANTGYYSLLAAKKQPQIQVHAFEPASAPCHYLEENIKINALPNIRAHSIALSDKIGEVEFFELINPAGSFNKFNLAGTGTLRGQDVANQRVAARQVRTMTLDTWMEKEKANAIDLIKVDTEGTEHLILQGAEKLLRQHQPVVICETLFHVIEDKLEEIMGRFHYRFFNFKNGRLYETSTLLREKDNGVRDCFFVPNDKVELIERFIEHK